MICIIGPTASGKTALAVAVAHWLSGEIISADSRQVYRGMDLGTGKDLSEYSGSRGEGMAVPYHLIDILPAGDKYDVFRYQQDFDAVYSDIVSRGKMPVLCGGSGLYIEAAIGTTNYVPVPVTEELRTGLAERSLDELSEILTDLLGSEALHNHTDTDTREHALRAIEIATYKKQNPVAKRVPPPYQLFTLHFEPSILRSRIKER
ncbi:MAG: tRNA (adenosine(37)-N6)-dimethylallyltransferase MiaA, partial [Bacteroidales bacterium]|nr:tRNA (adenosine(37)-N6)-dimethylallyltransferase MiaA [Bacteroidales bacterium]